MTERPTDSLPPRFRERLQELAADIAELYDMPPDEALNALRAALDNELRELPKIADGLRNARPFDGNTL